MSCPRAVDGLLHAHPCRVVNTRRADFPAGTSGRRRSEWLEAEDRTLPLSSGPCGIPTTARAVALNIVVADTLGTGYLTLYPGDAAAPQPRRSTQGGAGRGEQRLRAARLRTGSGTIKVKSGSTGSTS